MAKIREIRIAAMFGASLAVVAANAAAQNSGDFDLSSTPDQSDVAKPQATSLTEVTLGVGGATQGSAAFGRYNGMPKAGVGLFGSFDVERRDPWDSGTTQYLSIVGTDLNVGFGRIGPEASVALKYGQQGSWSLSVNYDAMTYFANDKFLSILDKQGMLPAGYRSALDAAGANFANSPVSTGFYGAYATNSTLAGDITWANGDGYPNVGDAALAASTRNTTIGTRRDKGTVGFSDEIGDWLIGAKISVEHKHGSLEASMSTTGYTEAITSFPMPVSYDNYSYLVSAAYTTPDFQASFSYLYSDFVDNNRKGYAFQGWNYIAVQDPVSGNFTSYPMSGVYSLPANNQAHTFKAEVAYNVDPTTRVYGQFVYGLQLQNSPFVAATLNAYVLADPASQALLTQNPASLDGLVQTFFGNLTVTSRPLPKLDIKATYNIDVRDPQTRSMWIYGTGILDFADGVSLSYRQAVPESWTKQEASLTVGYHVLDSTKITLGYAFRDAWRGNAITHHARESEESVRLDTNPLPDVTAWLRYTHANRTASAPDFSLWLVQINSDCTDTGTTLDTLGCQQVPFYQAARTRNAVKGLFTAQLDSRAAISLFADYANDRYHVPAAEYNGVVLPSVGINRDYTLSSGTDLTYTISRDTELHAYYTFMRTFRAMRALNDQNSPTISDMFYYEVKSTYDIHALGLGGTWRASDKLKLSADYEFSYGGEQFVQSGSWSTDQAGQTFGGDPLLSTGSGIHHVKLHAAYDYSADTSYYVSYQFDSLAAADWALIGPTAGEVLTGNVPSKYNVSTIMAAVALRL